MKAEQRDSCRVLVAEDDPPLRQLLVTTLRRQYGTAVDAARNGAEAIELMHSGPRCGVLVLDLMMPTKSGWDVIAWLAENSERLPRSVIVVTAADRAILREIDPGVVNAIFFKPFDILQFGAYVKAACELGGDDRRKGRLVRHRDG